MPQENNLPVVSAANAITVETRRAELRAYMVRLATHPILISNEAEQVAFSKAFTEIHDLGQTLETNRKADKKPHLDASRAVDAFYAEPLDLAEQIKTKISHALGAFRTEENRKKQVALAAAQALAQQQAAEAARRAQEAAQAAAALAQQQAAEAAAQAAPAIPGLPAQPNPAPMLQSTAPVAIFDPSIVQGVLQAAATQRALITAGTEQAARIGGTRDAEEITIEIVDPAAVPRQFCTPSEALIKAAAKRADVEIPGVKITRRAVVRPTGR